MGTNIEDESLCSVKELLVMRDQFTEYMLMVLDG
jgi:hypothetical protein